MRLLYGTGGIVQIAPHDLGRTKENGKNGHEISNHSWTHKNAKRLTLEQVRMEIEKNDSAIFANIGVMPVTYCYPYNYKTDEIVELASKTG